MTDFGSRFWNFHPGKVVNRNLIGGEFVTPRPRGIGAIGLPVNLHILLSTKRAVHISFFNFRWIVLRRQHVLSGILSTIQIYSERWQRGGWISLSLKFSTLHFTKDHIVPDSLYIRNLEDILFYVEVNSQELCMKDMKLWFWIELSRSSE